MSYADDNHNDVEPLGSLLNRVSQRHANNGRKVRKVAKGRSTGFMPDWRPGMCGEIEM